METRFVCREKAILLAWVGKKVVTSFPDPPQGTGWLRGPHWLLTLVVVALVSTLGATSHLDAAEILTNWTASDSAWTLSAGDTVATGPGISGNAGAQLLISPDSYGEHVFAGTMKVNTQSDDDFIGLVVGLQNPTTGSNHDYILIDWAKGPHSILAAGIRLWSVNGSSAPNIFEVDGRTLVDSKTGANFAWEEFATYTYTLTYTDSALALHLQGGSLAFQTGLNVFNATPGDFGLTNFAAGRFAFAESSQSATEFKLESVNVVPEPSTAALLGTLGLLGLRRRVRRRATGA